jgi:hypothetical protein
MPNLYREAPPVPDSGIQPPYLDPSQYPNYLDLQRKQMLAQMLTQTAQQSAQTPAEWNSMKVVPRRSPLANVTTLASALMAGKAMQGANQAQQNYFQGLMGGGPSSAPAAAPAPQAAPPSPPPPGLLPPNGIPGSQGPPGPAPAGLVPPQAPPAPAPPQQPPARNPMIPEGMSTGTAQGLMQMMGPQEYGKSFVAPQFQPTDLEKTMRAAGIDPGSALGRQIMQQAVAKQNYIAPIEQRPGAVERDPITNAVIGQNPTAPQGAVNFYDPAGNLTGQGLAPGATAAIAGSNAAATAGKVSQTPIEAGVDASGRKVYEFPNPPAMPGSPGAQGQGAPGPGGINGQTASAATLASQKSGGESGQAYASELAKNATGATEVRRSLSELKNLATQATPGAMNEGKMKLGSYMIAAGVSPQTAAGWLGVDVGALQAAQKQTATLAVNTIHSMTSRGTNFDLETFMRNNPNMNMSDPSAFQRVVDYMDNKSKQEIAKQKDFVGWKKGVSPDDWESGHTAHWLEQQNQNIDAGRSNSRPPLSSFVTP